RCRRVTSSGISLAVLGWLLGNQARGAAAHTAFTQKLEGVTVADIMDVEPVALPAARPATQAFDEFFLRCHGYDWFAVTEADGRYLGRAYREPVREAAQG